MDGGSSSSSGMRAASATHPRGPNGCKEFARQKSWTFDLARDDRTDSLQPEREDWPYDDNCVTTMGVIEKEIAEVEQQMKWRMRSLREKLSSMKRRDRTASLDRRHLGPIPTALMAIEPLTAAANATTVASGAEIGDRHHQTASSLIDSTPLSAENRLLKQRVTQLENNDVSLRAEINRLKENIDSERKLAAVTRGRLIRGSMAMRSDEFRQLTMADILDNRSDYENSSVLGIGAMRGR